MVWPWEQFDWGVFWAVTAAILAAVVIGSVVYVMVLLVGTYIQER
jgi:hypothetical protein